MIHAHGRATPEVPLGPLALACLGRGGICGAVADVPFAALGSPHALARILSAEGWVVVTVDAHVEVRCPVCRNTSPKPRSSP